METDRLHGDVSAGMSAYHELPHVLVERIIPTCPDIIPISSAAGARLGRPGARVMTMSSPVIRWTGCFSAPGVAMPTSSGRCCGPSSRQGGEPS